jgi:hypothetical protein
MNAGSDYVRAKRQAQANADYTRTPRWLHYYAGFYWITAEAPRAEGQTWAGVTRERIDPKDPPKGYC